MRADYCGIAAQPRRTIGDASAPIHSIMAYEVTGHLSIQGTVEVDTTLALGLDAWMYQMFGDRAEGILEDIATTETDAPTYVRLLELMRFEEYSESREQAIVEAGQRRHFFYQSRWHEDVELTLRILAMSGYAISCEFVGDDDTSWACESSNNALVEDTFDRVRGSRIRDLEAAAQRLHSIHRFLLSHHALASTPEGQTLLDIAGEPAGVKHIPAVLP